MDGLTAKVLDAVKNSPNGITTLDMLESLKLCDNDTLKTLLSRLGKTRRIIHLKRGTYASNPLVNAFAAAQSVFNGYVGFSSALYLHKLITELPFEITIVTLYRSGTKSFGAYSLRAVALKEKSVGFEDREDGIVVSTRAKTLFDCTYMERYSVEKKKLISAYRMKPLSKKELLEFDTYVEKFVPEAKRGRFDAVRKAIAEGE